MAVGGNCLPRGILHIRNVRRNTTYDIRDRSFTDVCEEVLG
jgi:hypothetical protein